MQKSRLIAGFLSKKEYAASAESKFIEKLNVACDATFDKIVRPKFNDNVE